MQNSRRSGVLASTSDKGGVNTRHSLDSLLSTTQRRERERKYVGHTTEILRDLSPDRERPDNVHTLPRNFGSVAKNDAKRSSKRVRQTTVAFTKRTEETSPTELQLRKQIIEETRRKLDEDWYHRLGTPLKNPDPGVPTRFSVRPPHKNTFEILEGGKGTSFHASNSERLKTTKQSQIDNQEKVEALEKEAKAQRDNIKIERLRQHLNRVVQCYNLEESARQQKELKRIEGRATLRQQYVEAVEARKKRLGEL